MSGVSQRRAAKLCSTTQITVARKLVRLAFFANIVQEQRLAGMKDSVKASVFDEMETSIHSKCMPAKGRLAEISRRRYGKRRDDRKKSLDKVLGAVARVATAQFTIKSDQCPRYPGLVRKQLPGAEHKTFKGRRGCVVGQGELKAGGRDPLFSLNHTCAMVRDNVKCLSRKTWCTTKRLDRLQCRLDLYVCWHNAVIDQAQEAAERRKFKGQGRLQSAQKVWPLGFLTLCCA